jgi:predicted phage terminase large subunit-like protein
VSSSPSKRELRELVCTITQAGKLDQYISRLSAMEVMALRYNWEGVWARDNQLEPIHRWQTWLLCAGRGFGKTKTAAELVVKKTMSGQWTRVALVAEDAGDARDVMVEGVSGILACSPPWHKPEYNGQKRRVTWPNGAIATVYSDADPEALRGPAHDGAWIDELAKFRNATTVWSNLMLGLRIGENPQAVVTTTPKPVPIIRDLFKRAKTDPGVVITHGTTYDNRANLPEAFYTEIIREYEGTILGRQELNGELLDLEESGIIKRSWFRLWPADKPIPVLRFILQSYDTAFTDKAYDKKTKEPDFTACFTFGVFDHPSRKGHFAVMILDCWQDQLGYPALKQRAYKEFHTSRYGPKDKDTRIEEIVIEDKGSGISLRQDMQSDDIPVFAYNPGRTDKTQRLHLCSPIARDGLIYWPESTKNQGQPRDWCEKALEQICSFPLVEHDDYVDAFSQGIRRLRDLEYLRVVIDEEREARLKEDEQERYTPKKGNPYAS